MPQKKATTKPHGLDKKKTDTLAYASNTAFIPFGRGNAWREIMDKYKKAAKLLMNCVGEGSTIIQLPDTLIPSTLKEAYEVQTYIETPDNPRVGWKLAATSIAGQKHIGVSGPIVGLSLIHI